MLDRLGRLFRWGRAPRWLTLLRARGKALWSLRKRLGGSQCSLLLVDGCFLLRAAREFIALESQGVIGKQSGKGLEAESLPLTRTCGECWLRQRAALTQVALPLAMGAARVEGAAERCARQLVLTLTAAVGTAEEIVIDLKAILEEALAEWVVEIAAADGVAAEATRRHLHATFLPHWRWLRYPSAFRRPAAESAGAKQTTPFGRAAQLACESALALDPANAGLAAGLCAASADAAGGCSQQSLTAAELAPNLVNAMVAGFETTLSLVMWTLVELGAPCRAALRSRVRAAVLACARGGSDGARREAEAREALRALKRRATAGEPIDAANLGSDHHLVRALYETLRRYPPVWTLPRAVCEETHAARFACGDVLCMSGGAESGWDPDAPRACMPLASFGVGERHCPAGASGLVTAFVVLSHVIAHFDLEEGEIHAGNAVASSRLGPTLCVDGPQHFRLRLVRSTER